MKKALLFAGLWVSAILGFEYLANAVINLVYGSPTVSIYARLILGIVLLLAAVLGIVLTANALKKNEGQTFSVPSVLLLVCAAIVVFGYMTVQIVEATRSISYYSNPDNDLYGPGPVVSELFIKLDIIYIVIALVEGLTVTVLTILSLVKSDEKKRN